MSDDYCRHDSCAYPAGHIGPCVCEDCGQKATRYIAANHDGMTEGGH